jgi:hypothetical protein
MRAEGQFHLLLTSKCYDYSSRVSDGQQTTVAVTSSGKTKTVYERNSLGPAELKIFQQAVRELAEKMVWTAK